MDRRLINPFNQVEMHVAHHYQYAWNRFLGMIEEQKLKISGAEKEDVKNYIFFRGLKSKRVSVFQKIADKCLMEAKEHFGGKK